MTSSSDGEEYTAGLVKDIENVNVVMVSAGDSHTMALSDNGTVFGWGTYRVMQLCFFYLIIIMRMIIIVIKNVTKFSHLIGYQQL